VLLHQRVMLIANHGLTDLEPPRIGALGEIAGPLDADGDYEVYFPEHLCTVGEPTWFIPASYLVPIDDYDDAFRHSLGRELDSVF
jgi:hypothetical protein